MSKAYNKYTQRSAIRDRQLDEIASSSKYSFEEKGQKMGKITQEDIEDLQHVHDNYSTTDKIRNTYKGNDGGAGFIIIILIFLYWIFIVPQFR